MRASIRRKICCLTERLDNTATIYSACYEGGANGTGGSGLWARNATITPINPPGFATSGLYNVVFDSPHPDGDEYHISLSGGESGVTRDNPKVTWVRGTKTENGFQVMVTTDDNGGSADDYNNSEWSFSVNCPVEVIVP